MSQTRLIDNLSQGEDREQFMQRVRAALGRSETRPAPPPPRVDENLFRLGRPSQDLVAVFVKNAEFVGMEVRRSSAGEVVKDVLTVLGEIHARRIVMGVGSLAQGLTMRESIRRKNIEIVDWSAAPGLEAQFDTDAGITDVHAALAETGTLVCCSDAGHSRGLSLVPPVHIAIVRKSDIIPDMLDLWPMIESAVRDGKFQSMPSSIALITGPSKTADIEGQLVTGVHGPGREVILLVEDA
ncbi:MAG: hypothetical protein GC164_01205 [Phycisphaera sp.]|nr:hypothetical protein [Phycisphaera sp.]